MISKTLQLIQRMTQYEKGVPHRIQHFLKVHTFALMIAEMEGADERTVEILRAATIVHDIGIKPSIVKYSSSAGEYQQIEGPEPAREMLKEVGYDEGLIERVCYLIAHHHTYTNIDGLDYQILVEADFLVNIFEDGMKMPQIISVRARVFKTKAGIQLLEDMYLS